MDILLRDAEESWILLPLVITRLVVVDVDGKEQLRLTRPPLDGLADAVSLFNQLFSHEFLFVDCLQVALDLLTDSIHLLSEHF